MVTPPASSATSERDVRAAARRDGRARPYHDHDGLARDALEVQDSRAFRWTVRAGFVARALTYGIIGGLAVALAAGAGRGGSAPNQQGALTLIASAPLGRVVVAAAAVGLLAYALWKFGQAFIGTGPEGGGGRDLIDRVGNFGGGVVYLAFFGVAVRVIIGSAGNQAREQKQATAGVLGWPGGHVIVAIAGAVLILISLYQCYDALRGKFAEDNKVDEMGADERSTFLALGRIGLTARALVFALIGYFLVKTAIDAKPSESLSLDQALARVHGQPFGTWLLGFAAVGLLVFAAFSLFEARHRRL
jgi:uncharacterized membrane protein